MKDPYETLRVKRDASPDDIRKAYRRLAKKLHPDLNPGNKDSEERFKEASLANELLSDPDKRKRFDAGEIDATGAEKPRERYYKDYAAGPPSGGSYSNSAGFADLEQFLCCLNRFCCQISLVCDSTCLLARRPEIGRAHV